MRVHTIRRALILAPMGSEVKPLVKQSQAHPAEVGGRGVHRARVGEVEVVIAQLGVGPEVAHGNAEWFLSRAPVDHVVVCGVAGGLHPDLSIGTLVVPETVLDLDSGRRYESAPMRGVTRRGLLATTDRLIVEDKEVDGLQADGILALEMESSGVAAACVAASVPWTTFRSISDRHDQHLIDDGMLSMLRPDGTPRLAAALGLMARHPGRIPPMMRLGRDSSLAASTAAGAALDALRRS